MKHLFFKHLVFLLLISLSVFSQDGKFNFTLPTSLNTSAGVFKTDGTLVRTLWNNVRYPGGKYTKEWDGKDDLGNKISTPESGYQIKILTNNVQYEWQGTIGNTSDNMTGPTKHKGYYHCMKGLAFGKNFGYFCSGYSEGSPSFGKFDINTPNQRINLISPTQSTADINIVATDGVKVYWAALDANTSGDNFVFATNVSDDKYVNFSQGNNYTPAFRYPLNVISYERNSSGEITGLAVQKKGNFLFVARSGLNQLQVLNKTTGALLQVLNFNSPKSLSIDNDDNLWMISGTTTVSKYAVNSNGTLSQSILTLTGLVDPQAIQANNDGSILSVADGGKSQQVKFFNNNSGSLVNVFGETGGYTIDATVKNNKFYFNDLNAVGNKQFYKLSFIAYEPNGSFWVNDPGNFRVQHYNANKDFVDRIMSLGCNYTVFADKNNISKVFVEFLEFEIDYAVQTLTGSNGWKLVKNWGATASKTIYDGSPRFQTTLSNGRTYGVIRNVHDWEVVEFPSSGTMRFTGINLNGLNKMICNDGSIQEYSATGKKVVVQRYPLAGFDGIGNPQWNKNAEFLAEATSDDVKGNPVGVPIGQIYSTSNDKVVFFNAKAYLSDNGPVYASGFHLGVMQKGTKNAFLFQTEKSTHKDYNGEFPNAGFFDVGNGVNDYAGGGVNIIDKNIITSYHGEFWKNGQTNKFNHYYDNGLAIGQFGTTGALTMNEPASAMMAGNALSPVLVKDNNGDLYLWHGDESHHAAAHRWKITGLNTIQEQTVSVAYPANYSSNVNYTDLMAGLPFAETLNHNTAGWTRDPYQNIENDRWVNLWTVYTSRHSYEKIAGNDITIGYNSKDPNTSTVNRDLGANNVSQNWKITGNISYNATDVNFNNTVVQQFIEVLDPKDKVLTSFYIGGDLNTLNIYGNKAVLSTGNKLAIEKSINQLLPFEVNIENGLVTFKYGDYKTVSTSIMEAGANWRAPAKLRLRFTNTGSYGQGYGKEMTIQDFKFYKDYNNNTASNKAPVANAGNNIQITLPANTAQLNGSSTDDDGTVNNYAWAQISGPNNASIVDAGKAGTLIKNLVEGTYFFELSVTDNDGAVGKASVQVTVSKSASNLLPAINPSNITGGLDYKYYEGNWDYLPAFSSLNPVKTGNTNTFDLSPANKTERFGFSFTGYINVPSDGQYKFYTSSDDGSKLLIDDVLVVNNDGLHGTTEESGTIGLKAGKHAITGLFFQKDGDEVFIVNYEGAGISKRNIPASELYRNASGNSSNQGNLLPAVYPSNTVNGLNYKYYEGSWNMLPSFNSLNPVKTGNTNNFSLSNKNRSDKYGFDFKGYIDVPVDGQYKFYTASDDGSKLYIDNVLVVDNDGLHSNNEQSGTIGLKAGKHAINGLFFQQGGDAVFVVSYEGGGYSKQQIPAGILYRSTTSYSAVFDNGPIIISDGLSNVNAISINSNKVNSFKVYPNPVDDFANLSISAKKLNTKISVSVYNSVGVLVNFKQLSNLPVNSIQQLDMSLLSNGVYSIIVKFEDGEILNNKVVKLK